MQAHIMKQYPNMKSKLRRPSRLVAYLVIAALVICAWAPLSLAGDKEKVWSFADAASLSFEELLQRFDLDDNGVLDGHDVMILLQDADAYNNRSELDLNDDGIVDIYDGVMLAILLGLPGEHGTAKGLLDFNNDGHVDLKDYRFPVPNLELVPKLIGDVSEEDLKRAGWQASIRWIPYRNFILTMPP